MGEAGHHPRAGPLNSTRIPGFARDRKHSPGASASSSLGLSFPTHRFCTRAKLVRVSDSVAGGGWASCGVMVTPSAQDQESPPPPRAKSHSPPLEPRSRFATALHEASPTCRASMSPRVLSGEIGS